VGESYCFGGENEIRNIDIANLICEILDEVKPRADGISYQTQIRFVQDRMGHDYRYAINNHKSRTELNFSVSKNFSERLRDVVKEVIAKI
jgi:dTDP-glucose 4,6-dehydratase